jgi:hemin uptake protein HemP
MHPTPPTPHTTRPAPPPAGSSRVDSRELLGNSSELQIVHGEQVYRLRRTAFGKLILTK